MKTQMRALATNLGGHLVKTSGCHAKFAKAFRKLAADVDPLFGDLAALHEESQAADIELAQRCGEFAKILDKAAGFSDDLGALQPTQVSAVTGDAPPASLRMVPRSGQREISQFAALDKSGLADETIRKIVSVD